MALSQRDRLNLLLASGEGFSPETMAGMLGNDVADVNSALADASFVLPALGGGGGAAPSVIYQAILAGDIDVGSGSAVEMVMDQVTVNLGGFTDVDFATEFGMGGGFFHHVTVVPVDGLYRVNFTANMAVIVDPAPVVFPLAYVCSPTLLESTHGNPPGNGRNEAEGDAMQPIAGSSPNPLLSIEFIYPFAAGDGVDLVIWNLGSVAHQVQGYNDPNEAPPHTTHIELEKIGPFTPVPAWL